MLNIQTISLLIVLSTSTLVNAHGHLTSWTVNGQTKAGFNPSYPPQYGPTAQRPTDEKNQGWADFRSGIVACGGNSPGTGVETWDLDAGSTVTAHWNTWPDGHQGPVTEYMARCPGTSCDGVAADSLDWFKIQEANYANGRWPTQDVAATLKWDFQIPADLAPGPYLVRHDLLAMHTPNEPQFYPVCFQANLKSSGSAHPAQTVKFPAAYEINPQFKDLNLYYGFDLNAFTPPGPPVYVSGAVSPVSLPTPISVNSTASSSTPASTTPTAPSMTAPVVISPIASMPSAGPEAIASSPTVKPPKTCSKRRRMRDTRRALDAYHAEV